MDSEVQEETIERVRVPEIDAILGKQFKVLDKGFVRVVDYMGGDASIVQAARVSYGKGTKKLSEDEGLIRYLLRHSHTTPFEMCEIKLHVRIPMDHWRQWIRHRTASVNEYSTRYSEAIDDKQETPPEQWRLQSGANKQGSDGLVTPGEGAFLSEHEREMHALAASQYKQRLEFGVAKEQARKDLPLSTYTEAYWKIDLHNLFHFLSLRMDAHAQLEIRQYATIVGEEIISKWVPLAWAAFNDYDRRRGALLLTLRDRLIISSGAFAKTHARGWGWLEENAKGELKTNRERQECEKKLEILGITRPW